MISLQRSLTEDKITFKSLLKVPAIVIEEDEDPQLIDEVCPVVFSSPEYLFGTRG